MWNSDDACLDWRSKLPDLAEFSGTHDFGVTGSPSTAWAPSRVTADESKLHLMFPDRSTVGALEHSVPCRADEWSEASPFLAARPSHRRLRSAQSAGNARGVGRIACGAIIRATTSAPTSRRSRPALARTGAGVTDI